MGNSRWNRMVSIPVNSLTQEELREAIHEWAEGCEELEKLLWTCYHKGIETGGSHVGKHNNYFEFYVDFNSTSLLQRILSAAETYGFAETFMMFGGNPFSGPNWYRTNLCIECLIPEKVAEFYSQVNHTLEDETQNISARCFALMLEFAEFFEDKLANLRFRMKVRNHSEYELFIETSKSGHNVAYFDELFGSFGMIQMKRDDSPVVLWYINGFSEEDFYLTIKTILDGIRSKWKLETPTEIVDEKNPFFNALIMQKKFGTTPEGVKKMNDWINSNCHHPMGRKVNY